MANLPIGCLTPKNATEGVRYRKYATEGVRYGTAGLSTFRAFTISLANWPVSYHEMPKVRKPERERKKIPDAMGTCRSLPRKAGACCYKLYLVSYCW
jgi:hypothetical protein